MTDRTRVMVETGSNEAAEQFLRDYAVDAVDRLENDPACERFSFVVMGHPEAPFDRRYVGLFFEGSVEEILEAERTHWEALREDGPVVDWERQDPPEDQAGTTELGEREEALAARQSDIETRISAMVLEEFDELPAPVDTYPEESEFAIGFWEIPHTMFHQLNYDLQDELDMYVYGIEHTLRNYAEHDSPERADAELDDLIERIEDMRESVKDGRLDS